MFFFLQQLTPISFDGTPDRVIAKTFPENNRLVVLFNNKDADRITSLQDEIEKIPGVSSTASFQSTLDKKRDAEDMIDFLDDMDSEVDMDASDLRLMYYDYFKNGEAPSVKVADMFTFINDDLLPKEKYAKEMDEDIKKNIASMVNLSDRDGAYRYEVWGDMTAIINGYSGDDETLTLPLALDGHPVTAISSQAFARAKSLKRLTIPGMISKIPMAAFAGCLSLQEVTVREGVADIGKHAFGFCISLKDVYLPRSLSRIDEAFPEDCGARFHVAEGSYARRYCEEKGYAVVTDQNDQHA